MSDPVFVVKAISHTGKPPDRRPRYTRCGVVWERKSGEEGFYMRVDAHSVSGEYLILPADKEEP